MKNFIIRIITITLGAFVASFALQSFLIPNNMIDGGIVGVAIMTSYLTKLNLGFLLVILNLPFVFLAFKKMGKLFVFQMIYAVLMLGVGVNFFHSRVATNDILLATIFGGVVLGIGVGLVLRNNAAMDGTEILALRLSKRLGFSIGEIIMFFNIFIYSAAGFIYGAEKAMYSVLVYFVTYKVIDIVLEGVNESKSMMIVSEKSEDMGNAIIKQLDIGITYIKGRGGYSGDEKDIIYCVVSRLEMSRLKELVKFIDPSAFISVQNVHEVEGVRIREKKAKKSFLKSLYLNLIRKRKNS